MPSAPTEDLPPRVVDRRPSAQLQPFLARFMLVEYFAANDVHFPTPA